MLLVLGAGGCGAGVVVAPRAPGAGAGLAPKKATSVELFCS